MVNISIISSNPKAEQIRRFLQTTINSKIDVVADTDQALQDIFVKRPTVVCIQSRIADINAADIARHIQMLLRNGAPAFILMHEGDASAKPVKGLFEHLLDLTLPDTELAEALDAALKSILGTQWEHVRLPPHPQKDRAPETTGDAPESSPEAPGAEGAAVFELANTLDELMTAMPDPQGMEQEKGPHSDEVPVTVAVSPEDAPVPSNIVTTAPSPSPTPSAAAAQAAQRDSRPTPPVAAPSVAPSPGDFRITTTTMSASERKQDDIAPFIENFELPNRRWKRRAGIALAIMVCAAAGVWYLLRQKPVTATGHPSPPPSAVSAQQKLTPVPTAVHKAVSSVRPAPENAAARLPAFVPVDGRDSAYAARHPGWERYVGTSYECRFFRENNRIRAVQVLATTQQDLSEELLRKVLAELAGNTQYRVASRKHVGGYLVERGNVADKADLMLYRKNSKLHAIVVSLN